MTSSSGAAASRQPFLARRNYVLLAAAVAALIVGYVVLSAGHPTPAAVLLVLGYCVLFPLGLAL